jgi:hypothetical protein
MDKRFCKYYKLRKYTNNCGDINWYPTAEYVKGDLYEVGGGVCPESIEYRWSLIDEYDCQEVKDDDYILYFSNGEGATFGCYGDFSSHGGITGVTIPSCAVTIPTSKLSNLPSLVYVNIESGITNIGDEAFKDFPSLSAVSIPTTVKTIGKNAFTNCVNLRSISLGSDVDYVGVRAFSSCPNLTNAVISCKKVGATFPEDAELPYMSNGTFKRYYCTDERPELFGGVFANCQNLTSVTINEGVEYLGGRTFNGCDKLLRLDFPSTLKGIGSTMGEYTISGGVIGHCSSLTYTNSFIGFCSGCTSLTAITINDGIEFIGNRAFENCYNLENITILATTPPALVYTLGTYPYPIAGPFHGTSCPIYVPAQSVDAYKSAWTDYADRITSL